MKDGFIHVCFIIDESGSMGGSEADVCGGFNKVIEEQKAVKDGSCAVSVYRFESKITKEFIGRNVNEIGQMIAKPISYDWGDVRFFESKKDEVKIGDKDLTYSPNGGTAMNDGIGRAITEIGEWLAAMPEEERPEKNLIVIMTDGGENESRKYTIEDIKKMIKHQAEVYDWSFVYMGTDITDSSYAEEILGNVLGCAMSFSDRSDIGDTYAMVNNISTGYRNLTGVDYATKCCYMNATLSAEADSITANYEKKIGKKIK